jgi:tryptophanase
MELVRLALPRRVYTQSHADYVVEVFEGLAADKGRLKGLKIVWQPERMRHFSAKFSPL